MLSEYQQICTPSHKTLDGPFAVKLQSQAPDSLNKLKIIPKQEESFRWMIRKESKGT